MTAENVWAFIGRVVVFTTVIFGLIFLFATFPTEFVTFMGFLAICGGFLIFTGLCFGTLWLLAKFFAFVLKV